MAQELYAPEVPAQNEPDYSRKFRPASPYHGNEAGLYAGKAKEAAYSGLGHAIGSGFQEADQILKQYVTSETHRQADPMQEAMTHQLEDTRDIQEGAKQQKMAGDFTPTDPMWQHQDKELPQSLQSDIQGAKTLQDAREYGKVPYTYYLGRLNELAKSLRAQWPGYRQEIDAAFHQITGHPIGNAYMMSLISDIQHNAEGKDKFSDTVMSHLVTVGTSEHDPMLMHTADLLQRRLITAGQAAEVLAGRQNVFSEASVAEAKHKQTEATDQDALSSGEHAYNAKASAKMYEWYKTPLIQFAGETGQRSLQDLQSAGTDLTPEQAGQVAAQSSMALQQLKASLKQMADNTQDASGRSVYSLSPDHFNKLIDEHVKQAKEYIDLLSDPNKHGLAYWYGQRMEMITQSLEWKMVQRKFGDEAMNLAIMSPLIQKLGKDAGLEWYLNSHRVSNDKGIKAVSDYITSKAMFQEQIKAANPDSAGPPLTLASANDTIAEIAPKDPRTGEPTKINSYKEFVDNIEVLAKTKNIGVAQSLAFFYFDRANNDVINFYKRDDVDAQGRHVDSQASVYAALTDKSITKAMAKLPQEYKDKQRNWAETEFQAQFTNWIQDLSKFRGEPGIKIAYDKDNHEITTIYDKSAVPKEMLPQFKKTQEALEKVKSSLNIGLRGLANVEEINKVDPNATIAMTLSNILGGRPEDLEKTLGAVPDSMAIELLHNIVSGMKSVAKSALSPMEPDTPGRRLKKEE